VGAESGRGISKLLVAAAIVYPVFAAVLLGATGLFAFHLDPANAARGVGSLGSLAMVSPSCSQAMMEPAGRVSEGESACGVTLGSRRLSIDCRGLATLPAEIKAISFDSSGNQTQEPATVSAGGCRLQASMQGVESGLRSTALEPKDLVVIADFTPGSSAATVFMDARCATDACLSLALWNDGTFAIAHYGTGDSKFSNIATGNAALRRGQANRLLLYLRGQTVVAYLNGKRLATTTTSKALSEGLVALTIRNEDSSQAAAFEVQRLYIFQGK